VCFQQYNQTLTGLNEGQPCLFANLGRDITSTIGIAFRLAPDNPGVGPLMTTSPILARESSLTGASLGQGLAFLIF
jgi:hypothetical protein